MLFGKDIVAIKEQFRKEGLNIVDSVKFLGLFIDEKLKWTTHTNFVASKLASLSYCFRRLRGTCSAQALRIFYFAQVASILSYNIVFWGFSKELANEVFIWQKRIFRHMLGIGQRVSCKEFFRNKEILTVSSMFIFEIIKHVKLNSCEFEWFDHGYNTKHNNVKCTMMFHYC